jgi:hypothetical protein
MWNAVDPRSRARPLTTAGKDPCAISPRLTLHRSPSAPLAGRRRWIAVGDTPSLGVVAPGRPSSGPPPRRTAVRSAAEHGSHAEKPPASGFHRDPGVRSAHAAARRAGGGGRSRPVRRRPGRWVTLRTWQPGRCHVFAVIGAAGRVLTPRERVCRLRAVPRSRAPTRIGATTASAVLRSPTPGRGPHRETHVPTEEASPCPQARVPPPHAHPRRAAHHPGASA